MSDDAAMNGPPTPPGGGERRRALQAERERDVESPDRESGPPPPPALVRPYARMAAPTAPVPVVEEPGSARPSSDAGEPVAGEPVAGQPDADQPDAGQPDADQPDAGQPDADQTAVAETGGRDADGDVAPPWTAASPLWDRDVEPGAGPPRPGRDPDDEHRHEDPPNPDPGDDPAEHALARLPDSTSAAAKAPPLDRPDPASAEVPAAWSDVMEEEEEPAGSTAGEKRRSVIPPEMAPPGWSAFTPVISPGPLPSDADAPQAGEWEHVSVRQGDDDSWLRAMRERADPEAWTGRTPGRSVDAAAEAGFEPVARPPRSVLDPVAALAEGEEAQAEPAADPSDPDPARPVEPEARPEPSPVESENPPEPTSGESGEGWAEDDGSARSSWPWPSFGLAPAERFSQALAHDADDAADVPPVDTARTDGSGEASLASWVAYPGAGASDEAADDAVDDGVDDGGPDEIDPGRRWVELVDGSRPEDVTDGRSPDEEEPVRGTLAPVLRRSTERAKYPTSSTPVIRPPVLPPPPGEASPAARARVVSWEEALAGEVVPGAAGRRRGRRVAKARHESGGAGEYRPRAAPDRSLTLLVVGMLLMLLVLVGVAVWAFWPRVTGTRSLPASDAPPATAPPTTGHG